MRVNYNEAIEAIAKYTSCFSHNVSKATKETWVELLMELRADSSVLRKAILRCAENDLGASWSRLRAAIDIEGRLSRERGEVRSEAPQERRGRNSNAPPEVIRARSQVIKGILAGRIKYPKGEYDEAAAARWFNVKVEEMLMKEAKR